LRQRAHGHHLPQQLHEFGLSDRERRHPFA
jgi:hypothetical protein